MTSAHEIEPAVLSGTQAHCRRVAAWCQELARVHCLPKEDASALVNAALMHHEPDLSEGEFFARLTLDLGLKPRDTAASEPLGLSREVLAAYRSPRLKRDDRSTRLARLLEDADTLDEQLEYAPFGKGFASEQPGKLQRTNPQELLKILSSLPVFPAIAMQLFKILRQSDTKVSALASLAESDPVIAGKLMDAANSRSVGQAVACLGTDNARRLMLACSLRPLFEERYIRQYWRHALEAAQVSEKIASLSGDVNPGEAFLIGLLHDVGKQAIALLPRDLNETISRLAAHGCEISAAESVICGFSHAEAGAEVLKHWNFSEEFVDAVRNHHQPEQTESKLASILYLTEFWTDSEEDLPSNSRLRRALKITNLTTKAIDGATLQSNDLLLMGL